MDNGSKWSDIGHGPSALPTDAAVWLVQPLRFVAKSLAASTGSGSTSRKLWLVYSTQSAWAASCGSTVGTVSTRRSVLGHLPVLLYTAAVADSWLGLCSHYSSIQPPWVLWYQYTHNNVY